MNIEYKYKVDYCSCGGMKEIMRYNDFTKIDSGALTFKGYTKDGKDWISFPICYCPKCGEKIEIIS